MGRIKSENFSIKQNAFVIFNHCLANPARLAIVEYLLSRKSSPLPDILEAVNLGDDAIRKHLRDLVETGFVQINFVRGVPMYYAHYPGFLKWSKMVNNMHAKFMDLLDGHPQRPVDTDKEDLPLSEVDMEKIRAEQGRAQPGSGISSER